ncbi:MAG TPA: MFS transporter [Anaerolineales bacterium]|nr:MFS transporter [Anaerolineales bacterium]
MAGKSTPSMFSVFRNRSFTLLWTGQMVSAMGSALTALAASILVFRVTGSALSVGLMLIATSGPTVLIGLFAGVFVDRFDRKRIMLASDLLRALLIFLIPFLIPLNIGWLYVIVALTSAITQFFDSAHASILPEIASDEELSAANALMAISSVGSMTVGFAVAGIIASSYDIKWVFYLDAFSFLVSALLILFNRLPSLPPVENTSIKAIGHNLKAGLQTVSRTPILRSLFILVGPIFLIFGFQNTLLLPFALRVLKATEFHFGLQQAAETVGIALGSLIMARLADRIREGMWLAISYLSMAVVGLMYAFSPVVSIAIFLMGVTGFVNAPSFIGRQLVIQRATPRDMRGRVNSAFFVVRDTMFVSGMALAGLADVFNVRMLFVVSSFALFAAGAVVLVLPGLGQPAAEWKRILSLLRGVEAAPRLGAGRTATRSEIDRFVSQMKELEGMTSRERDGLAAQCLVAEAPGGKIITYRGELSDAAYYILKGSVAAGYLKDDEYVIASILREGDFFGEIAALTGTVRTANIITEEESEFLILPSKVLRGLSTKYEGLKQVFFTTIAERLSRIELPHGTSLDQGLLRELRTNVDE